jgi:hypothetical protein
VSETPAWIVDYAQVCRRAFGLEDWPIAVIMQDCIDGDDQTRALTTTAIRTLDARLQVRRDLTPGDDGYVTLTHEFLHMATIYADVMAYRIMDMTPKKHRALAERLWRDGLEQSIERLARALTPLLRAQLEEPKSE